MYLITVNAQQNKTETEKYKRISWETDLSVETQTKKKNNCEEIRIVQESKYELWQFD